MSTIVLIDGEPYSPAAASVSVFDRGFLYGDSVFETIRTYAGHPFALTEHLQRLARSAERVLIELPASIETIAREVHDAIARAGNPESYVRVMVTRGSGPLGLDTGFEASPRRVVIVTPLVAPSAAEYERGIGVATYRTQRVAEATDAVGAKVGNYLVAILAMQRARELGASEALIIDAGGNVVEGATSNIFAVLGTRLVTPGEDAGILPGITRARVLEVARAQGMVVELRSLTLEELMAADELFVSSSIRELMPVVRVDETDVGRGAPGPVARQLLAAFRDKVRDIMGLDAPVAPGR